MASQPKRSRITDENNGDEETLESSDDGISDHVSGAVKNTVYFMPAPYIHVSF